MSLTRHLARSGAVALVGLVSLAGCGSDGGSGAADTKAKPKTVTLDDVWARTTPESQTNGAIYLTVKNDTDADIDITGAAVPADIGASASLHQTTTERTPPDTADGASTTSTSRTPGDGSLGDVGGMTSMQAVADVPVPAGKTVTFKPGGFHIMVMGLDHLLTAGETFPVTLTLSDGTSLKATVTVRSA